MPREGVLERDLIQAKGRIKTFLFLGKQSNCETEQGVWKNSESMLRLLLDPNPGTETEEYTSPKHGEQEEKARDGLS